MMLQQGRTGQQLPHGYPACPLKHHFAQFQIGHVCHCSAGKGRQSSSAQPQKRPRLQFRGPSTRLTVHAQAAGQNVPTAQQPTKVVIAGAGIGGLVLAVGLLKRGFEVKLLERDLTAIRGEGKYRGPIQIQSNALAALEAIDKDLARKIFAEGCVTGDRINGLVDGVSGKWYVKFDTYHPAVKRGLPVTRVISRTVLQRILAEKCEELAGKEVIENGVHVVDYEEKVDPSTGRTKVCAITEDGRREEGDLLIGADGIRSKVRRKLVGQGAPTYSQYTCYTGIADFTPPDIDTVGYRVFLGNRQYFVSSDVGDGKMQWYGFHKEPAGGKDVEGTKKQRLLSIFGHWTDMVTDLIKATPESDVLRRDIYDRPPILKWTTGRVALLGDSAHAMQPNLGQGGCMAIEDGYQLAKDLGEAEASCSSSGREFDPVPVLQAYQRKRVLRASTIHGLAGMAAIAASTYKAYLGEGLGPLSWIQRFKIPHPGRVGGYLAMNLTMPTVLSWVLGGNYRALDSSERIPYCMLEDAPKEFHETDFYRFMSDDRELLRASKAQWVIVPAQSTDQSLAAARSVDEASAAEGDSSVGRHERAFLRIALPHDAIDIGDSPTVVGRHTDCCLTVDSPMVCPEHARLHKEGRDVFITDLGSKHGTWLNDRKLSSGQAARLVPGDTLEFGKPGELSHTFKIKMCHDSIFKQLSGKDSIPKNDEHPDLQPA